MTKSSCIQHPPSTTIVMIREDYLVLCQDAPDPHCAAALLNNMEFWTNIKLANSRQIEIENAIAAEEGAPLLPNDGTWVYKTHEETQCDLLELFGRNKIVNNMTWLVSMGYLTTRANPRYKWDKTKQYSLNIETLQDAISNLPSFKTKRSNHTKLNAGKAKTKRAIPETTTENTPKTTTKNQPNGKRHFSEQDMNAMKEAIREAFKWESPTKQEWGQIQRAAYDLLDNHIAVNDVRPLYRYCRETFSVVKPTTLIGNVSDWRKSQPRVTPPPAPVIEEQEEDEGDFVTLPDDFFEGILKKK